MQKQQTGVYVYSSRKDFMQCCKWLNKCLHKESPPAPLLQVFSAVAHKNTSVLMRKMNRYVRSQLGALLGISAPNISRRSF